MRQPLPRKLNLAHAFSIVMGSMIGSGIFFFISPIAQSLQSVSSIFLVWCLGALITFIGGLCLSELSAAYPSTGGYYVYLNKAFGEYVGFLFAWCQFILIRIGSLVIAAIAFAEFTAQFLHLSEHTTTLVQKPLALTALMACTLINLKSLSSFAKTQIILTFVKIFALLFIFVSALFYFLLGSTLESIPGAEWGAKSHELSFASSLIPILWAFGGWDQSSIVAGEIKDPGKNLPKSILYSIGFISLLYFLVHLGYFLILTPSEIAASGDNTAVIAMQRVYGGASSTLLAFILMVSSLGIIHVSTLTGARVPFAAGEQHRFFAWFNVVSDNSQLPSRSLWVQSIMSSISIFFADDMIRILNYTGIVYWLFTALMALSVIILRQKDRLRNRPFLVPWMPWLPLLFAAISIFMMVSSAWQDPMSIWVALCAILLGSCAYKL